LAKTLGLRARYGSYALVTGAARGIGRAFARCLAAEGFGLLLVDREADSTRELARELAAEHGIDACAILCDLAEPGLSDKAREWANNSEIGLLVNNAGISSIGRFLDLSLDAHLETLHVNCRATLVLTHVLGEAMASRGRGAIIIVSSASGFSGSPYFAHYAATKGYGLNLASGLWSELRGSGIDALAVCPGMTNTKPIQDQRLDQNLPFYIPLGEPETVAAGALRALGSRPAVIPTPGDRLFVGLAGKVLPRSTMLSAMKRTLDKMRR